MEGSSQAMAASSSHMYSSSAYLAMYRAAGVGDLAISAIICLVRRVLMEMSTGVSVILAQLALSAAWEASGSIQKLNSRRGLMRNSGSVLCGLMLPPMTTSSWASEAKYGSIVMASARSVSGPAATMVT